MQPRSADDQPSGDFTQQHVVPSRGPAPEVSAPTCAGCGNACAEVCRSPVHRDGARVPCGYRLPRGWRSARSVCVAMAGARSTGKSIYIGVLVKQLQQLRRLGMTVIEADDDTARTYAEFYEKPLYAERNIMPPTGTADARTAYQRTPLVYSLRTREGAHWFLALRDVAGEDLEQQGDARRLGFFAQADGVVFLFDPLAVPAVRASLSDTVLPQVSSADPERVLARTLELVGGHRPRLAVVLSKFDAMHALAHVEGSPLRGVMRNPGAACQRDRGPLSGYDEDDARRLHEEVRSLLDRLRAESLVGRLEWSGLEHRYFAVSALGEAPTGQALHGRGIAPFRCLDPIKWLMAPVIA